MTVRSISSRREVHAVKSLSTLRTLDVVILSEGSVCEALACRSRRVPTTANLASAAASHGQSENEASRHSQVCQ